MSSEPTGWTTPVTNRVTGHVPTISDFNVPEMNTQSIELGNRTLNPALAGRSITGTLRQFLSWFAGIIELITGVAWPGAPATNLATANTHITAAAPHTGHETPAGAQSRVDTHAALTTGTHGVGASTVESVAGAQAKVNAHAGLTNNPHAVTVAQIGAETPASAQSRVDTHAGLTTAHGISSNTVTTEDLNTIVVPGFYRIQGTNLNAPPGSSWGQLIVSRSAATDTILQLCAGLGSDSFFWRSGNPPQVGGSGSWLPWQRIGSASLQLFQHFYTANHTLILANGDGAMVTMESASALTLTVPTHATVAFPIGTQILIFRAGTGAVTIVAASGVTLQAAGNLLSLRAQFSVAGLVQRAINVWTVMGDLS